MTHGTINPLPDPAEIATLEERRQALGVALIADHSQPSMGGMLCSGPLDSWMNRARGIGLEGPVSDDELDGLVDYYRERGHTPAVEMCPYVHDTLMNGLHARGFAVSEFLTCWAFALEGVDLDEPDWLPEGIALRLVDRTDSAEVERWATTLSDGFNEPGTDRHRDDVVAMSSVAAQDGVFCMGAYDGDRLIGASAAEVSRPTGGRAVAGFFSASVSPEFRNRGIQRAMIRERLRIAKDRGAWVGCIESKPGIATERNARRMGFFPAYTKLTVAQVRRG